MHSDALEAGDAPLLLTQRTQGLSCSAAFISFIFFDKLSSDKSKYSREEAMALMVLDSGANVALEDSSSDDNSLIQPEHSNSRCIISIVLINTFTELFLWNSVLRHYSCASLYLFL